MKKAWRNNYNSKLSWFEVFGKEIKYFFKDIKKRWMNGGSLPTIVTFPDYPSKRTTIFKIADGLNYRLTNKLKSNASLYLFFHDDTFTQPSEEILNMKGDVINISVTDISKKKVDEVHLKIFGYNTSIDPLTFHGMAVKKNNLNALHDGQIIQCPLTEVSADFVYQILIDNMESQGMVVDMRVPVMKGSIPLCYKKYKAHSVRFTNEVSSSSLHDPTELFSAEEIKQIEQFSLAFELDFGELDILRHTDGRIFIIDVNKTPYGPPVGLSEEENKKAVSMLTTSFKKIFLSN